MDREVICVQHGSNGVCVCTSGCRPIVLVDRLEKRGLSSDHTVCRSVFVFFFQAEDGIRDLTVTGVQTCALPISAAVASVRSGARSGPLLQRPALRGLGHRRQLAVARGTPVLRRGQTGAAVRERQRRTAAGAARGPGRDTAAHLLGRRGAAARAAAGGRAHGNLMRSINPLGQLEIVMDNGHGGKETRYLEFDFHRVMGADGIKHVLCAVGDITSSVLLARELQESQENANAQVDMMLSMLHVEPLQLMAFLDTAGTSLNLVNGILREPARSDAEVRKKLGGLFRELHGIKGEASALNLKSVASRVHALEDMVADCKKKPELSGSDFLPLVLKLDDLLAHLRSVRDMGARLTTLKESGPAAAASVAAAAPHGSAAPRQPRPVEDLSSALQSMAERLAEDHAKRFRLTVSGLSEVPPSYAATIKDCVIQMLRNAAVHGIEPPEVRRAHTKHDVGAVSVHFRKVGEGYELVFEDDRAGIATEALEAAALLQQLVSEGEARGMGARAAMALIFPPRA